MTNINISYIFAPTILQSIKSFSNVIYKSNAHNQFKHYDKFICFFVPKSCYHILYPVGYFIAQITHPNYPCIAIVLKSSILKN